MPRYAINYLIQEIIFYRFVCQDATIINTYVGSTVNFVKRKQNHKSSCNNPNGKAYNFKVYLTIRENGGWCDWKMVEIERRICKDRRDAERIEQEWIEKYESDMNMKKAYITDEQNTEYKKQYRIDNAVSITEYKKQYYIDNKETSKQYRIDNAVSIAKYKKQYRIDNAVSIAEYKKKYQQTKPK